MTLMLQFIVACLLSALIIKWGMDRALDLYPPSHQPLTPVDVLERKD